MHLDHPETYPLPSVEKLSSTKPISVARKCWGLLLGHHRECGQGQLARVYVREHHGWPEPPAGRRGGEKRGGLVFLRTGGWPRRGGRILLGEAVGARFF